MRVIIAAGQEANEDNLDITKTYLYNFDPLKPYFYIVKTGFFFDEAVLPSTNNLCFEQTYEKYQNFYLKTLFLAVKFSLYLNRRVFVMDVVFVFYDIMVCKLHSEESLP